MISKFALAFASLFLAAPSVPDDAYHIIQHPQIALVTCGPGSGTAFRISKDTWLSVNHVTSLGGCAIDGTPIEITYASPEQDFAILKMPASKDKGFKINCGGFKRGEYYFGIGHAQGLPWQQIITVRGTGVKVALRDEQEPISVLEGDKFIPGQSGGPVLNSKGEVVGTVNAYSRVLPISFSRALKDTVVCQR